MINAQLGSGLVAGVRRVQVQMDFEIEVMMDRVFLGSRRLEVCIFVLTETKTLQTREASCLDNTGSKWTVCNPEPEQLPRQHAPAGSCRLPRRNKACLSHRKRVCLFPFAHWPSSSSSFLLTPSPLSLALSLRGAVTTPRRRFRCF
jgi:hypothetical protein